MVGLGPSFDGARLVATRQPHIQMMKRNGSPCESTVIGSRRPVFDIVNGFFKIDAVRCSILGTRIASAVRERFGVSDLDERFETPDIDIIITNNLAEIIIIRT